MLHTEGMVDTSAGTMWTVRTTGRWAPGDLVELRVDEGEATVIPRMLPGLDFTVDSVAVDRPDDLATFTYDDDGEVHALGVVVDVDDPSIGQTYDPDYDESSPDSRVRLTVRAATRGEAASNPRWAWFVA